MPIYEYKCEKCGYKFEKLVFGEEKLKCPKCQSESLKKLFSTFSTAKKLDNSSGCEGGTCDLSCPTCGD